MNTATAPVQSKSGALLIWCPHCKNHLPKYRFYASAVNGDHCRSCHGHRQRAPEFRKQLSERRRERNRMGPVELLTALVPYLIEGKAAPKWMAHRADMVASGRARVAA